MKHNQRRFANAARGVHSTLLALTLSTVTATATPAFAQCVTGPDAATRRAVGHAFEAQNAVADHLDVVRVDRDSRDLSDAVRDRERRRGKLTAQASLNFATASVTGFDVCDGQQWEQAKLDNQALGAAIGFGARDIFRLELRIFGVSDSVVQRDLDGYYPARQAGLRAPVPGAAGAGHGVWSVRTSWFDTVSIALGQVSTHSIRHSVGWDEEFDDDGNSTIARTHVSHWSPARESRFFVALGAPRYATTDLIVGRGSIERAHLRSGWITPRPNAAVVALRGGVGYDGVSAAPVVQIDTMPLFGPFAAANVPSVHLHLASELHRAVFREAAIIGKWGVGFDKLGLAVADDLVTASLTTSIAGGSQLHGWNIGPRPGASLEVDVAIPIIAVFRLSAWSGINRPATIRAVPDAVGRPEWGVGFYVTYAL